MKKVILLLAGWAIATGAYAQDNALWLRHPAISPDGQTIAVGFKGDIYLVPVAGGTAVPLTVHPAMDMTPVWSHDGKSIAFASDRFGNFDVFVIPVTGGTPKRLTYNSMPDYPYDFTPDNKAVLFGSPRTTTAASIRFNNRIFNNLYTVPVTGGSPQLLSAAGAELAHYNASGTQVIFQDRKGYEDAYRKHHLSAVTRDIWVYDLNKKSYTQISSYAGEDREPVFSGKESAYYLSERNGISQNIYKVSLADTSKITQLTHFDKHPVRDLSVSANNTICFTYNGEVYTLQPGAQPQKLSIRVQNDGGDMVEKNIPVTGNLTEFALSPNGKEIAFVSRGEVYVTNVEGSLTKRITNTPQQERMVAWSPDGKSLVYAAERRHNWDIYRATLARADEPYFYASTVIHEEPLIATKAEEFQPSFSPDGKELAYVEDRNVLRVYNLASKQTRTVLPKGHNHSYSDGDWDFSWSPDGKWLLADDQQDRFGNSNAALIPADGKGSINYPVNSGFGEGNAKWSADGKVLTWESAREGRKSLAIQGSREVDIYAAFFDKEAYDRFNLSKDEFNLLLEKEEQAKKSGNADSLRKVKTDTTAKKSTPLDLEHLDDRQLRFTINSASISDYVLNKDASKVFYLAAFEKGFDLWVTEPRTHETKILAKLGGTGTSLALSKDGKTLYASNHGSLVKVDVESGKITPIATNAEMVLNAAEERAYIFEHAWRQVKEKFYDPNIHGIDWEMYRDNYARFLPYINNNYDFQELLSELLGELNGSHTGGRYSPVRPDGDATASLGLFYDENGASKGLLITDVMEGGPFDKASSKVKKGDIIEQIDGQPIADAPDWAQLLNRKAGKNTLVALYNPATGTRWFETVKPVTVGEESELLYKRWVNRQRAIVEKLSGGKVGYIHVRAMNDASFRAVFDEAMGRNRNKQALIIDTRFNGGGWLHDDLNTFLSGKKYLSFAPQGDLLKGGEPMNRWQQPSCVLISQGNYSDAFIFPYVYKQNGVGKLIGMPVAGTGTAVWWETQIDPTIVFGIPMVATIGKEGRPTENLQVEPDIRVPLPYNDFLEGKDPQLEAAVKEMLQEIK
ncbi:C-terminal processing protease CtpA/Prc, contains a PDZ domain [Chitinophaga costaii]|uniref:Tricorn protease homolog n=1 Tax=Chitinophaga costaii TaxID=1335309 RepID=A0A1C4DE31_9BACT|nr:S41 family peptidase [Chitinophaga costaii]PUZ24587.1 PDZ domain-containing protein [Chitinophaga costaii]SCC29609.1 C-terminal processing protease CtpA/Prc, contains a PDZ domain [Chitinophaga costaii]